MATLSFSRDSVTVRSANTGEQTHSYTFDSDLNTVTIQMLDGYVVYQLRSVHEGDFLVLQFGGGLGLLEQYSSSRSNIQGEIDDLVEAREQERLRAEEAEREREEEERQHEEKERLRAEEEAAAVVLLVNELLEGNFVVDIANSPQGRGMWGNRTANDSTLVLSGNEATYTFAETRWSTENPLSDYARNRNNPADQIVINRLFPADGTQEFTLTDIVETEDMTEETYYKGIVNFANGDSHRFYLTAIWRTNELRFQVGDTYWTRVQPLQPRN
jgi:hypothetical protein